MFGTRGTAALCQCQRFKLPPRESFRSVPVFAAAGFTEVSRPSKRRVVMRIDFPVGAATGSLSSRSDSGSVE